MVKISMFRNPSKKGRELSKFGESNHKETRDSRIDADHSESTAPIDSDRSGSSRESARDNQALIGSSSLDSVPQDEACRRWSFGADINIAKMSGPGFFKTLTTLEAMNANSDEENEDDIYTDRENGAKLAKKKSSSAMNEPTSSQAQARNPVTKSGKDRRKSKSPKRQKKAKKGDEQPSDSASAKEKKQQKKKKRGKTPKSKKHDKDTEESPIAIETKDSPNTELESFRRALQGSNNTIGHAPADAKKSSPSADFEKLFAFQRKLKGGTSQKDEQAVDAKKSSNQAYQSFAEIEKLSAFQRNLKGNDKTSNDRSKEGNEAGGNVGGDEKRKEETAATSRFADFFNNSIYQSVESSMKTPENKLRKRHQPESSVSAGGQQLDGDVGAVDGTKESDNKTLKQVEATINRGFVTVRRSINEQMQFLDAIEDEEAGDDPFTVKEPESIQPNKRESYQKIETELRKYESMLETERTELSKQKLTMQLEQQSLELLLDEEVSKNKSLQLRVRELEVQLESSQNLKEKNLELESQIELLRKQNAQHKQKISKMMTFEKSEVKRNSNPSLGDYLTEEVMSEYQISATELEEQSGFLSIASMSSKAQGELLKLRSSLKHKSNVCQQQSEELAEVKQELESLKERQGVKELETHVEQLEGQKQFFMAQVERLQKELTMARDEAKNTAASTVDPPTDFNNGRWFTFGNNEIKAEVKSGSNGSNHSVSQSQANTPVLLSPTKRLSGVLNDM